MERKEIIENALIDVKQILKNYNVKGSASDQVKVFGDLVKRLEPIQNEFSDELRSIVGDLLKTPALVQQGYFHIRTVHWMMKACVYNLERELENMI